MTTNFQRILPLLKSKNSNLDSSYTGIIVISNPDIVPFVIYINRLADDDQYIHVLEESVGQIDQTRSDIAYVA